MPGGRRISGTRTRLNDNSTACKRFSVIPHGDRRNAGADAGKSFEQATEAG
jgi:hypothetical protein